MAGSCVFGQSGGPTAAINSSALGIVEQALESGRFSRVLAMRNGIEGFLSGDLMDLTDEDPRELRLLRSTPASFFGSCRYKMRSPEQDPATYRRLIEILEAYDISSFFYIGGNDSMDTCAHVDRFLHTIGFPCRVVGVPKTIDNDLPLTDHSPGYGSAAKYIATSVSELYRETKAYKKGTILVLEIMGRDAGWLTAASALAGAAGQGPDLVYLPEAAFDLDQFVEDCERAYARGGSAIAAVSEGVRDREGRYVSSYGSDLCKQIDVFGHRQMGGLAATLTEVLKCRTGIKTRGIEFSLLQRCAAHCASGRDLEEAYQAGAEAVRLALGGVSGCMVAFQRLSGEPYAIRLTGVPLEETANKAQRFPVSWINGAGNGVTDDFLRYGLPLIQGEAPHPTECGLPRYPRLRLRPAEPAL